MRSSKTLESCTLAPGQDHREHQAVAADQEVALGAGATPVYRVGTSLLAPLSVKEPRVKRGRGLYFSIRPSVGGSRWRARAGCRAQASDGSHATSGRWTPSLISVLGLRLWVCPLARQLHDDRWGVLPSNTDAAARSFEAAQLEEENLPRWQRGAPRSWPLPGNLSTSSYVSGSAKKRTNLP